MLNETFVSQQRGRHLAFGIQFRSYIHLKNCYCDERDVLLYRLLFLNSPSLICPG